VSPFGRHFALEIFLEEVKSTVVNGGHTNDNEILWFRKQSMALESANEAAARDLRIRLVFYQHPAWFIGL